jgi:hypothetical protein
VNYGKAVFVRHYCHGRHRLDLGAYIAYFPKEPPVTIAPRHRWSTVRPRHVEDGQEANCDAYDGCDGVLGDVSMPLEDAVVSVGCSPIEQTVLQEVLQEGLTISLGC